MLPQTDMEPESPPIYTAEATTSTLVAMPEMVDAKPPSYDQTPPQASAAPTLSSTPVSCAAATDAAAILPTYEEVRHAKMLEMNHGLESPPPVVEVGDSLTPVPLAIPLGSDSIFIACFLFAFLFNWMGIIAVFCLSYTMAARCGAISGFGLSIVKWATILKNSNYKAEHDDWIWWLFIVMGFVIFIRGSLNYLAYKNQNRLQSNNNDEIIAVVTTNE